MKIFKSKKGCKISDVLDKEGDNQFKLTIKLAIEQKIYHLGSVRVLAGYVVDEFAVELVMQIVDEYLSSDIGGEKAVTFLKICAALCTYCSMEVVLEMMDRLPLFEAYEKHKHQQVRITGSFLVLLLCNPILLETTRVGNDLEYSDVFAKDVAYVNTRLSVVLPTGQLGILPTNKHHELGGYTDFEIEILDALEGKSSNLVQRLLELALKSHIYREAVILLTVIDKYFEAKPDPIYAFNFLSSCCFLYENGSVGLQFNLRVRQSDFTTFFMMQNVFVKERTTKFFGRSHGKRSLYA